MSITDITNKIITDASEKSANIIKAAEITAKEISSKTEVLKKNIENEYSQKTIHTLKENEKKIISAAEQEVKLHIDKEKRFAVDTIFKNALKKISSLSDEEYEKIILSLFKNIPNNTNGKIIIPEEKELVTKKAIRKIGFNYEIETTNNFKYGFIFSEKNTESNFSFEDILKNKKSILEVEVARILFS